MSGNAIAINGANGFIGTHVVKALADMGVTPVCIVKEAGAPEDIRLLESMGARVIPTDTDRRGDSLVKAMEGCDRLIHLIGSIAPPKGKSLHNLQTDLAQHFFDSAKRVGVRKVVLVSALGCEPNAGSEYHRTKWLAEEALKRSGFTYVIIRPSLTVGREVGHRDSKLVRRYLNLIETRDKVPLVLGGQNRIQPIHVADLAKAFAKVVTQSAWDNQVLEVAGADKTTMRGFVGILMDVIGIRKAFTSIPEPLALCLAVLCETFQQVPLLSRDQLKIAKLDGDLERNDLPEKLGIQPRSLRESLQVYANEMQPAEVSA